MINFPIAFKFRHCCWKHYDSQQRQANEERSAPLIYCHRATIELYYYPLEEALAYLPFSRLRANKEADFALNLRFNLCSRGPQFGTQTLPPMRSTNKNAYI
jgi:hypothetical protein